MTGTKAQPHNPLAATPTPESASVGETIKIRIKDLCSWYDDFQALHNISLDIPEQRVTAFIGPSGCGKSTLLKWINRMNDEVPGARCTGTLDLPDLDILDHGTDVVSLRLSLIHI